MLTLLGRRAIPGQREHRHDPMRPGALFDMRGERSRAGLCARLPVEHCALVLRAPGYVDLSHDNHDEDREHGGYPLLGSRDRTGTERIRPPAARLDEQGQQRRVTDTGVAALADASTDDSFGCVPRTDFVV